MTGIHTFKTGSIASRESMELSVPYGSNHRELHVGAHDPCSNSEAPEHACIAIASGPREQGQDQGLRLRYLRYSTQPQKADPRQASTSIFQLALSVISPKQPTSLARPHSDSDEILPRVGRDIKLADDPNDFRSLSHMYHPCIHLTSSQVSRLCMVAVNTANRLMPKKMDYVILKSNSLGPGVVLWHLTLLPYYVRLDSPKTLQIAIDAGGTPE